MARVRRFNNVKLGLQSGGSYAIGPNSIPATQVWAAAPVPSRGAKAVLFLISGTDANLPAAVAFNYTNDPNGAPSLQNAGGSGGYNTLAISSSMPPNGSGGIHALVSHSSGVLPSYGPVLLITGHATNAIGGVRVDAIVFYDGDVADVAQAFGQLALSFAPSETVIA